MKALTLNTVANLAIRYLVLFTCLILLAACGRKGAPTLKAYEKPEPPSGLTAVHKEGNLILSWSYPNNLRSAIKGFHLMKDGGNGFERAAFIGNDAGSYIETGFRIGASYKYKLAAENQRGVLSADSNIIKVMPQSLPLPPDNIRFLIKTDSIELSWDSSGNDVCYNIYRTFEKDRYPGSPINREPVCITSLSDSILPDKSVYYRISGLLKTDLKDEGYPSGSLEVSAVHFIPSPPTDLRIAVGDDKVYLIWKESPETWVRGYRIYRKNEGDAGYRAIGESGTPAFTDKEITGKSISYIIKAIGPLKESEDLRGETHIYERR